MASQDAIERIAARRFVPQGQGTPFACPIRSVVPADSVDGAEQALVRSLVPAGILAVVSDENGRGTPTPWSRSRCA